MALNKEQGPYHKGCHSKVIQKKWAYAANGANVGREYTTIAEEAGIRAKVLVSYRRKGLRSFVEE
jgi:hypothetical protein